MDRSKSVALWTKIGAVLVAGWYAVPVFRMAWVYSRGGGLPDWPWDEWVFFACSRWMIFTLFWTAALKGDLWWGTASAVGPQSSRYKIWLSCAYAVAVFLVFHHYEPIAADLFVILFALIMAVVGLQIYFMPIESKLASIAKTKARHGFPVDQPHRIDSVLKSGYFRIP